ncbi:hypothetical protein KIPB_016701, partial [Kipferlia bialata]|eukprot:g16701.t1
MSSPVVVAVFLLLIATVLATDSCAFVADTLYPSSDVSECLTGCYSSDEYDSGALIGSAQAAASQYYLMSGVTDNAVMAGLLALKDQYQTGGDWSPYDLEMDIARVF